MIGNFSFEEHDRYFTRMYNHLRHIDRNLDITTMINIIKCKVILEQERENIKHNLNIKNIHDTPMVKDFKIWSAKYEVQSEEDEESNESNEDEEESEVESNESNESNEDEEESEDESEEDESNEDEEESEDEIDSDDVYDSEYEYFFYRDKYNEKHRQ